MLKISMVVETKELDPYVEAIAQMLVFPPPMQVREIEVKPGSVSFLFSVNGNEASSTVLFEQGSTQAVAQILDAMPYPTFLTSEPFLMMAAFSGGGAISSTVNFKNENHPANQAEEADEDRVGARSKR